MISINEILEKFVLSGWDLISLPAQKYLEDKSNKEQLIKAVKQADEECGSCGCEFDELYKIILKNENLL
ncbi:MAG: hypothetical protein RR549_00720 [Oscillospiraceae bacterium]